MGMSKINIGISESGSSIELSGKNANKLSKAVIDLLSPFTESAGWLGDIIRVKRISSVHQASFYANEIAKNEHINICKKAPKVIEEWVKGASYNDEDFISEKWGRLLLCDSAPSAQLAFIEFLSRLGGGEARWLDSHWQKYDERVEPRTVYAQKVGWLRNLATAKLKSIIIDDESLTERALEIYNDSLNNGIIIKKLQCMAFKQIEEGEYEERSVTFSWEPELIFPDVFEAMGIFRLDHLKMQRPTKRFDGGIDISAYFFSRLGAEFMQAINSKRAREDLDGDRTTTFTREVQNGDKP